MSNQEKRQAALDNLFSNVQTAPQQDEQKTVEKPAQQTASHSQKNKAYWDKYEQVPTVVAIELMNKVRYISKKETVSIKDLIEKALTNLIDEYESLYGPIKVKNLHPKKGNVNDIFKK